MHCPSGNRRYRPTLDTYPWLFGEGRLGKNLADGSVPSIIPTLDKLPDSIDTHPLLKDLSDGLVVQRSHPAQDSSDAGTPDMTDDPILDVQPALFTFFERMPRQGPGCGTVTADLYKRIHALLPPNPTAADMGCGSGAAGLVIAEQGAHVLGVDIHPPLLAAFRETARARGLADRIETQHASMTQTGRDGASFDLIWSEGAVFTVGFDAALAEFRRLLRPRGLVVLSECSWLQLDVPEELRAFWNANYPGMRTPAANLAAAESAGWRFVHTERLASEVWESGFYQPMERLIASIDAQDEPEVAEVAAEQKAEIDLFRRYRDYYGYIFYVLQTS